VSSTKIARHLVFGHDFFSARLPQELDRFGWLRLTELWDLHPTQFHKIRQPFTGKTIPLPRWQQAYGQDYAYTGTVNIALPVAPILEPFLFWVRDEFDARLNGLLLNWYDAEQRHYIGTHRDSIIGLVAGSPIVTISLGATRTFRLRPRRGRGFVDFSAAHGTVFVMPWQTNLDMRHEVPNQKCATGRRISITARAFDQGHCNES
jgi:alkylated DNA repair dioxygenase AlkB